MQPSRIANSASINTNYVTRAGYLEEILKGNNHFIFKGDMLKHILRQT